MNQRPRPVLANAAWMLLLLFVFSIPWEKSALVAHVGTATRLLGILALAAGAAVAVQRGSVRIPNVAILLAALLVLWFASTFFWSLDRPATAIRARTFLELLAMVWLIWDQCRGARRQKQVMHAYVLGAVVGASLGFLRYYQHRQTNYQRYAATGFDPNDFGLVLVLSIPIALYLALQERRWLQWYFYASVLFVLSAIFLTASRTAMLATFTAFSFTIWTWRGADSTHRVAAVSLAALALGMFQYAPQPQRRRLETAPGELSHGTIHDRTRIWKAGLRVLKSHFVVGVGSGAYPESVRPLIGTPALPGFKFVAHNTFLSVLVETGIIGFAAYVSLLAVLVHFTWIMPARERALWSVMLATWAVGVSTLTWEHYKPSWLIVALIMTEWARSYRPRHDAL